MKKKPKILIVMMLIVALVGCSPAWATETNGDEQNAAAVIDESDSGDSAAVLTSGTTATDSGDDSGSGESGELLTVNISDESISAIADAVAVSDYTYANQILIRTDDGLRFYLDTDVASIWDDYYICVYYNGSGYFLYIAEEILVSDSTFVQRLVPGDGIDYLYRYSSMITESGTIVAFENVESLEAVTASANFNGDIVFSNNHLYSANSGEIVYTSPYASVPTYVVSFVTGVDSITYETQEVSSYDDLELPDTSSIEGYAFNGWYFDEAFETPFDSSVTLSADVTLYGDFQKIPIVTFVTPFEDLIYENQYANVLVLPDASYEGYTFIGWFVDSEYTTLFSSTQEITEDITLYAKFVEESL